MLMNLFSSFDPFCFIFFMKLSLNWISSILGIIFLPLMFWIKSNRFTMMFKLISIFLKNEFFLIVSGEKTGSYLIFISLFYFILFNNFLGLFPYIFTSSSHLCFSMLFSLSFWMSFMIYGWIKNTNKMFCHLVPMGTPFILMPFLVCIETISNIIRPGTLAIRLTANMISGHLLLTLIGNQGPNLSFILLLILIILQTLLMILEISVSFIQSYVFSVLTCLYSSESN